MPETNDSEQQTRLTVLRIIWFALLMGQLMFFGVIVFVFWNQPPAGAPPRDERFLQTLFYIGVAMLVTTLPVGWMLRANVFRLGRQRAGTSGVPAPAYVTGNILFWAMCEGASFFGLVGAMLNGGPWPHLVVSIIAMAAQALTFPTGAPMRDDHI
jgi:hypothetical protein